VGKYDDREREAKHEGHQGAVRLEQPSKHDEPPCLAGFTPVPKE
jgi:hypothetical protein